MGGGVENTSYRMTMMLTTMLELLLLATMQLLLFLLLQNQGQR